MLTGEWLLMLQMSIVPSLSEFSKPRMTLKMNASCFSALSVTVNQFMLHNIPEDLNLLSISQFFSMSRCNHISVCLSKVLLVFVIIPSSIPVMTLVHSYFWVFEF